MKRLLLFSIGLVVSAAAAWGCSCFPIADNFCQTTVLDPQVSTVVVGEKTGDYYHAMRVKITQVLKGTPRATEIIVWGDNGGLCRQYTGGYAVGDVLVLALQDADTMGNVITTGEYPAGIERPEDYQLSGCGVYSLRVTGGTVTGYIDIEDYEAEQNMPMATFLKMDCANTAVPLINAEILPNPVRDELRIFLNGYVEGVLDIVLHTTDGREARRWKTMDAAWAVFLDASALPNGVYLLTLIADDRRSKTLKIVVLH